MREVRPLVGFPNFHQAPIRPPRIPNLQTQIQQFKGASQPSTLSSVGVRQVASSNMPKAVQGIITNVRSSGGMRTVKVSFLRSPDPFFQRVNVYLKQGNQAPSLVTSAADSPLSFTVMKSTMPSAIIVQSEGNWGAIPLSASPSFPLRLV